MALNAYPFESANTTEDQYTRLFRNFVRTGIVGSYGDSQFVTSTDGSGLDVQVSAGYAIIRGHAVENDGPVTVNIDTADAQFPRIDRIVLRLDPDADGIFLQVIKGTPNANPTPAPMVQTEVDVYDMPLALVRVPALALNISATDITLDRRWGSGDVGVWTTETRPMNPRIGTSLGYNVSVPGFEFWDGATWKSLGGDKKKVVIPHTFTLAGPINTPSASGDYFIPPLFLPAVAGQRARIVGVRTQVHHGGDASKFGYEVRVNGDAAYSGEATKTAQSNVLTGRPWYDTSAAVALVVTSLVGDPKNATVTLFWEYEV